MEKRNGRIVQAFDLQSFTVKDERGEFISVRIPSVLTGLVVNEFGITNAKQLVNKEVELDLGFKSIRAKREEKSNDIYCTAMQVL